MPKPLRGIFRKRRKLLDHLFRASIESLLEWMRERLDLPDGQLAAIAAVQTFGDYLGFHPHLHVLAASGLIDHEGPDHLERNHTEGHLPLETELAYQEELPDLFSHGFYRRRRRAYPAEESANGALLRSLLKQEQGLGGPLDVPIRWGWRDETDPPPADWWCGEEPTWCAPEFDFGDGRVLVLDAGDPFPVDDLPVYAALN